MKYTIISFLSLGIIFMSCDNSPKVITASQSNPKIDFKPQVELQTSNEVSFEESIHHIQVLEKMDADKYLYLKVAENNHQYWLAVTEQPIELGAHYYYRNGLLKTGFKSKVYNKVFDTIYLVSKIVPAMHGQETSSMAVNQSQTQMMGDEVLTDSNAEVVDKVITIAELVKNKEKYAGKKVKIKATCTKINPQIMNRNWIHLKDGSLDEYDLVMTSDSFVSVGKVALIEADVNLNRDFGAGYSYVLILENGVLKTE